jgi:putative lipase involved disintegration of autophagic bodies
MSSTLRDIHVILNDAFYNDKIADTGWDRAAAPKVRHLEGEPVHPYTRTYLASDGCLEYDLQENERYAESLCFNLKRALAQQRQGGGSGDRCLLLEG